MDLPLAGEAACGALLPRTLRLHAVLLLPSVGASASSASLSTGFAQIGKIALVGNCFIIKLTIPYKLKPEASGKGKLCSYAACIQNTPLPPDA